MGQIAPTTVRLKDLTEVVLRGAEESDAQKILDYAKEVLNTSEPYFLTLPEELPSTAKEEWLWLQSLRIPPNNLFFIAEAQGEIVGSLSFLSERLKRVRHSGEMGLSIREDFRDRGLGRKMLETLIEWAKARKEISKISLKVIATNERAIKLYENLDFEREGILRNSVRLENGTFLDEILMARLLR